MPEESKEPKIIPKPSHTIDPDVDGSISFISAETSVELGFFRPDTDQDFVTAQMISKDEGDGAVDSRLVRMGKRLDVAKEHTVEYLEHKKGKIAVVGSAVVIIAAGAGIIVRRLKK